MPYGVDKKIGGDNPSNDSFMEKCVNDIKGTNKRTGQPYTKGEKIAICKTSLKNKKSKSELIEYTGIDINAVTEVEDIIGNAIDRLVKSERAKTNTDALALVDAMLAKADFDTNILKLIFNR